MKKKEFYRVRLPHFQTPGQTYMITCILNGAIPKLVLHTYSVIYEHAKEAFYKKLHIKIEGHELEMARKDFFESRKKYFRATESYLHKKPSIDGCLCVDENMEVLAESFRFWEGSKLQNHAWSIMPNHFHWVVSLFDKDPDDNQIFLQDVMHSIKRFSANKINKNESQSGQFWMRESFDTTIRSDKHFHNAIKYVLNNPVKAKLSGSWNDWNGNYLSEGLLDDFNDL